MGELDVELIWTAEFPTETRIVTGEDVSSQAPRAGCCAELSAWHPAYFQSFSPLLRKPSKLVQRQWVAKGGATRLQRPNLHLSVGGNGLSLSCVASLRRTYKGWRHLTLCSGRLIAQKSMDNWNR